VRTGEVGIEIIKKYEGFSADPYLCPAGVPTIGFGSTRWFDGYHITMDSRTISRDDATRLLQMELHHIESAVPRLIKAPLTQNQFDALASFTFNLGSGRLQSSTLRARVNRLDYDGAADEFPKWCKAANKVLPGLVRRRAEERQLWLTT
jgi:lysozyme